ncbi:hypothetical protein CLDAP_15980 [Caldilinea aerophila DSM 14535 = NBRC 104270]|uniref:Uncharacterized protein n=1 Tax=Caldilinea aerophila (strain DSM 14535 / JCM 11387 / NBRC 104270 / STL-6-O1) TaxID=926550 RepID=I0I300_CALAS|nr:hypothetical protein CLDAP_15980 [Caldilinea aerophila DSM 14535 = NBRC 104270]
MPAFTEAEPGIAALPINITRLTQHICYNRASRKFQNIEWLSPDASFKKL